MENTQCQADEMKGETTGVANGVEVEVNEFNLSYSPCDRVSPVPEAGNSLYFGGTQRKGGTGNIDCFQYGTVLVH